LRFLDEQLEKDYQRRGGAESLTGFRIATAVAAVMWLLAAIVVPLGTPIPADLAVPVCYVMALANWATFLFAASADTLDRQHTLVSVLTTINAIVILWLASIGGVLPGYGISALMLLFIFGFVVAALRNPNPGSLLIDAFIFGAAVIGTLLALRLLEQSRRRVFTQDIVIRQQAEALRVEKDRADALVANVLPQSMSSRLIAGERTIADAYPAVTVLFADIVGFTQMTRRLPAEEVVGMLGRLFARFDELVAERGLEKIKTIGDAYMVAGGLPEPIEDHAARVVDLGLAMIEAASQEGGRMADLQLRVGVHSGPVIGGVIGHRKFAFDVWGETVNVASRLESNGIAGRVQVSARTWALVEDRFHGEDRGPIHLRGHGFVDTYAIVGRRAGDEGRVHPAQHPAQPGGGPRRGPAI
jgi:class 3 adenylate cyclase